MSGGSWDYPYHKFDEVADRLREEKNPLRRAFGRLIEKCSAAIHDIEWVDSGDYGPGDEVAAIKAALGSSAELSVLEEAYKDAMKAAEQLNTALEEFRKTQTKT